MPSSVDLGKNLEATVRDLVRRGRYNSRSEALREGVRLVQEREARLAALDATLEQSLLEADSGQLEDAGKTFDRLIKRHRRTSARTRR